MNGKPVEQAPRNVLKRVVEAAAQQGLRDEDRRRMRVLPDHAGRHGHLRHAPITQAKPCYDQQALMRRYDVITEICDAMLALGWRPYQNDHEDANGQFEMNWEYDNALRTADRHAFFKYMVKSIAEKHGLRATFMPKPFANLTGNGCHVHVSLWSTKAGKNLFDDPSGELGLSQLAYHFIGGVMHSAEALCAITNPTVNSYKRINAPRTLSGATWSPNTVTYTRQQPHAHDPHSRGRPLRAAARRRRGQSLSAAGGAAGGRPRRHRATSAIPASASTSTCTPTATRSKDAKRLPLNLLDALRALERSSMLEGRLGEDVVSVLHQAEAWPTGTTIPAS